MDYELRLLWADWDRDYIFEIESILASLATARTSMVLGTHFVFFLGGPFSGDCSCLMFDMVALLSKSSKIVLNVVKRD